MGCSETETISDKLSCDSHVIVAAPAAPVPPEHPEPLMNSVRSPESVPAAHFLTLASAASGCVAIKRSAVEDFPGVCDRHTPLKRKLPECLLFTEE